MKTDSRRKLQRMVRRLARGKYANSCAPRKEIVAELKSKLLDAGIPEEDHLIAVINMFPEDPGPVRNHFKDGASKCGAMTRKVPKAPKGWRKMRDGETVRKGDRCSPDPRFCQFFPCSVTVGLKISPQSFTYIRRLRKNQSRGATTQ